MKDLPGKKPCFPPYRDHIYIHSYMDYPIPVFTRKSRSLCWNPVYLPEFMWHYNIKTQDINRNKNIHFVQPALETG